MQKKTIVIIICIILASVYFLFLTFPLFFIGAPSPVFDIRNNDEENHFINVNIFDENKNSIFNKIYYLEPNESKSLNRRISFLPPIPSNLFTWDDGPYTFYFTLDDNIMKNITTNPWPYETIGVYLFVTDEPIEIIRLTI